MKNMYTVLLSIKKIRAIVASEILNGQRLPITHLGCSLPSFAKNNVLIMITRI